MADASQADRKRNTQALLASREAIEGMLSEIGAGMALSAWCKAHDCIYSTIQLRLTADEELRPLYEAARIRQAESVMDEMKEVEDRVAGKDGTESIDPKAAAVLLGSMQWRAERLNPKRYGQRSYQEVTTIDQTKQHMEALRLIGRRRLDAVVLPQQPALPVITSDTSVSPLSPGVIDAEVVSVVPDAPVDQGDQGA